MKTIPDTVSLIGNTPLLRLSRTLDEPDTDNAGPLVLAKIEYLNPGGSVKDRIATRMIEAAEESGELQPGGTIVEQRSSSGAAANDDGSGPCGGTWEAVITKSRVCSGGPWKTCRSLQGRPIFALTSSRTSFF